MAAIAADFKDAADLQTSDHLLPTWNTVRPLDHIAVRVGVAEVLLPIGQLSCLQDVPQKLRLTALALAAFLEHTSRQIRQLHRPMQTRILDQFMLEVRQ
jgi:hypothetical protein